MTNPTPAARLDEHDKDEWFDIVRVLKPGLTNAEYDVMWAEFQALKTKRAAQ